MTARTRSRNTTVEHTADNTRTLCNGTVDHPNQGNPQDLYRGVIETTNDVVTPDFHKRIARGEIINNAFSNKKETYDWFTNGYRFDLSIPCSGTLVKYQTGNSFYNLGSNKQGYLLVATPSSQGSRDIELASISKLVQTRALAGVVPADVDLLVDLYEWKQTVRLLTNPVRSLYNYIQRYKRGNSLLFSNRKLSEKQQAVRLIEDISSKWLALRYGVMPLVFSIQGGLDIVRKPSTSPRVTSRSSSSTAEYADSGSQVVSGYHWNSTLDKTTTTKGSARAYVLYEHELLLVERAGLHLSNLPYSIWEGIPFSFVVDWILNVGDYVRAVTPKAGVKVLATGVTERKETLQRVDVTGVKNSVYGYSDTLSPDGWFTRETVEVNRQPGIQAYLEDKLPSINFEQSKDWVHLIDAVSLLTSQLDYR